LPNASPDTAGFTVFPAKVVVVLANVAAIVVVLTAVLVPDMVVVVDALTGAIDLRTRTSISACLGG